MKDTLSAHAVEASRRLSLPFHRTHALAIAPAGIITLAIALGSRSAATVIADALHRASLGHRPLLVHHAGAHLPLKRIAQTARCTELLHAALPLLAHRLEALGRALAETLEALARGLLARLHESGALAMNGRAQPTDAAIALGQLAETAQPANAAHSRHARHLGRLRRSLGRFDGDGRTGGSLLHGRSGHEG